MPTIAIHDLPMDSALDRKALAAIKGGGAPWVFGWIRPFVEARPSFGPSINFYQINNNFFADQMVNQFQVIDVTNTAANSTIGVGVDATGGALKQQ
ncbi:hypothetical protein [Azoarcus sp. KH32C]|uniref:hypothetical protein n=1 Tax=Azoarcus sp. KH32C TaxID=748247 RepID=UPI0002385ED0|nr:hypothetical protein [Azoarcus sp. KH32C]BAL24496.1 hypothetical protein AZKH_2185 [Azoarcus sp. KH32C]